MSRLSAPPGQAVPNFSPGERYSPAFRPTWIDFFCLLIGFSFSVVLADWSGLAVADSENMPVQVKKNLLRQLPNLLLLPIGPMLLFPVFYASQWLRGRQEPLSSGEWLWIVAWLAGLPWTAVVISYHFDALPEVIGPTALKRWLFLAYAIGVLSLGMLSLPITLVGLVGRWRQPWTHTFCLVVLIWPAIWLGCCWLWGIELK